MPKFSLVVLSLSLTSFSLFAAGNAENGGKLYRKCVACHGKNGEGNRSQKAPRLAGQYEWYLETQIKNIRSQTRNVSKMYPFVKALTEGEIKDLAAFISSLEG